jgi:hypothetical protein
VASLVVLNVASLTWLFGYRNEVVFTQLGCSDGGQITQMSWVTMKDEVLLDHILDSQVLFTLMNKETVEPVQQHLFYHSCPLITLVQYTSQWLLFFLFRIQ